MKVSDETWDVRCPEKLRRLFPTRAGYYFRVDPATAGKVLRILSEAYRIPAPRLGMKPKEGGENAFYEYDARTVLLRPRNHLKTVFHEFYHHLDNMTDGCYDSDDREGGSTSFAWMFADKLWQKFTEKNSDMS
jgi:hypothetical protein